MFEYLNSSSPGGRPAGLEDGAGVGALQLVADGLGGTVGVLEAIV